jgi:hypothetical protein
MGDPKISDYKSSTLLRAICFFAIGVQATLMWTAQAVSIEDVVFLAVYGFGIYASKAKDERQMQVFGGLAALSPVARAFFDIGSFSSSRVATGETSRGNPPAAGFAFTGFENISFPDAVQLIIGAALLYLSYNIFKK